MQVKFNTLLYPNDPPQRIFIYIVKELEAELSKAAAKGFMKKNTASRVISKLSKKLKENS